MEKKACCSPSVSLKRRSAPRRRPATASAGLPSAAPAAAASSAAPEPRVCRSGSRQGPAKRRNSRSSNLEGVAGTTFAAVLKPRPKSQPPIVSAHRAVVVGSDCSGLGSECLALQYLGVPLMHKFASECNESVRAMYGSLHSSPQRMYTDVREQHGQRGRVDLYVSGFPCQPFSSIGRNMGTADPRNAAEAVLDYITGFKPKVVVLENVGGLVQRHLPAFMKVLQSLQKASYQVTWNYMRTDDHGIPHSRRRVYIVGIQTVAAGRRFEWPAPLKVKPGLKYFLDDAPVKGNKRLRCFKTMTSRRNWDSAVGKFQKLGVDFESQPCLVDLCAARSFTNSKFDKMPCLTASRGQHGGYYLTNQDRLTTVEEMARLQGWKRTTSSGSWRLARRRVR